MKTYVLVDCSYTHMFSNINKIHVCKTKHCQGWATCRSVCVEPFKGLVLDLTVTSSAMVNLTVVSINRHV